MRGRADIDWQEGTCLSTEPFMTRMRMVRRGRQAEIAPLLLDTPDDKVLNHPDSQMADEQNAYRSQWLDQYRNQGWVNFTQELCS